MYHFKWTSSLCCIGAALAIASPDSVQAEVVIFNDDFNISTSSSGSESIDLNFELASRQAAGTTTSTYTANTNQAPTTTSVSLNQPAGGSFAGEDVLRFRTFVNGGAAANAGVTLDTNFAPQLVGQVYEVNFTAGLELAGAPSGDRWFSFFLSDSVTAAGPNSGGTDYGVLVRDRDASNVTLWDDGSPTTQTVTDPVTTVSPFASNALYAVTMLVDEVSGTVTTTLNKGTANEVSLGTVAVDFENATDRYLGFRANQGAAAGLADTRLDNLSITVIPEPGSMMLMGAGVLVLVARRREG